MVVVVVGEDKGRIGRRPTVCLAQEVEVNWQGQERIGSNINYDYLGDILCTDESVQSKYIAKYETIHI